MNYIKRSILFLVVGVLLGVIGLLFGNNFWLHLGIENGDLRKDIILISTLTFLLVGFAVSIIGFMSGHSEIIENTLKKIVSENKHSNDEMVKLLNDSFNTVSYNGLEAMEIISSKILYANRVFNTRFINENTREKIYVYYDKAKVWDVNVPKAVKLGVRFRDVVLNSGRLFAEDIMMRINSGRGISDPTRYSASDITNKSNPIINFIIIEYTNEPTEIWFGWMVSPNGEVENKAFRSTSPDLLAVFMSLHERLFTLGEKIQN